MAVNTHVKDVNTHVIEHVKIHVRGASIIARVHVRILVLEVVVQVAAVKPMRKELITNVFSTLPHFLKNYNRI